MIRRVTMKKSHLIYPLGTCNWELNCSPNEMAKTVEWRKNSENGKYEISTHLYIRNWTGKRAEPRGIGTESPRMMIMMTMMIHVMILMIVIAKKEDGKIQPLIDRRYIHKRNEEPIGMMKRKWKYKISWPKLATVDVIPEAMPMDYPVHSRNHHLVEGFIYMVSVVQWLVVLRAHARTRRARDRYSRNDTSHAEGGKSVEFYLDWEKKKSVLRLFFVP